MVATALAFAATALAFAGVAVALALKLGDVKNDSARRLSKFVEAQQISDDLREELIRVNSLRGADRKTIELQKADIDNLRKLLREHAPDGVAASQFDGLLQEAKGQDGDSHGDSDDRDSVPE